MKKGSEYFGLTIATKNETSTGYTVKDLIYEKNPLSLKAFILKKEKDPDKSIGTIFFENITETKQNFLVADERSIIQPEGNLQMKKIIKNSVNITGFEVYSFNGELIGIVKDTLIELNCGHVVRLILSEGYLDDIARGYSELPPFPEMDFQSNKIFLKEEEKKKIISSKTGLKNLLGIFK